jgi:hypothetical protein
MFAVVEVVTLEVVIVNVALVELAATVTLAGTCAYAVLSLLRLTEAPPLGAAADSVTVPCELVPPNTLVGLSASELMVFGGRTVKMGA